MQCVEMLARVAKIIQQIKYFSNINDVTGILNEEKKNVKVSVLA